jgi:nucleoside-diphosphate-sugar epimerase
MSEWFVNVQDCARLHIAALLDPAINHQRIFAFAEPVNWTDAVRILREIRPQNSKIPDPPPNELEDLSQIKPRDKAEAILHDFWGQNGWTNLYDSIADGVVDL